MLNQLLDRWQRTEEYLSSRRQFFAYAARDVAVLTGLSALLQSSPVKAAVTKKLGNYPVMDMDGKYRDYSKKEAPILDVTATEIHKYPAGIGNYLKWQGNSRAGKAALIQFGSHWCGPCGANMPFLEQIYQNPTYQSVQVVGVNLVDLKVEPLEATIQKTKAKISERGVTYPNLLMHVNPMAATLLDHVPEGSNYPQILLVNLSSGEVAYVTNYLFELGDGKKASSNLSKLYREIEKILPKF